MKLLIAYDGSNCSDAVIDDLVRAGLPSEVEARVLSIVEETVESALYPVEALSSPMVWYPLWQPDALPAPAKQIEAMRHVAGTAADRLRHQFPAWSVDIETEYGVPGPLIIDQIKTWKPDLVAMGCHGRHGFSRLVLGSISQHVLNHSPCPVRITHPPVRRASDPIRLLIAMDASVDAAHALRAVASRSWPAGTEARVVGVIDAGIPLTIRGPATENGTATHSYEEFRSWIAHATRDAASALRRAGLVATHQVLTGDPAFMIMKESADWNADCIVLGARGVGAIHRLILGSVSSEVAAHANCSVEVIRHPDEASNPCTLTRSIQ